jgi:hypothetical protein
MSKAKIKPGCQPQISLLYDKDIAQNAVIDFALKKISFHKEIVLKHYSLFQAIIPMISNDKLQILDVVDPQINKSRFPLCYRLDGALSWEWMGLFKD